VKQEATRAWGRGQGWQAALIRVTVCRPGVARDRLTLHADHGAAMVSQPVAALLEELGVTKHHSRPHASNDHPFSEAQFKTLQYRPDFPDRFPSLAGALVDGPGSRRCNSHITQGFDVSPGSNLLSGCPTGNLEIGTYAFPWTMYVDVAGNYSTAEYTQVTWQPKASS